MDRSSGLLADNFDHPGMGVAERVHPEAGHEIQVAIAFGVVEENPFAPIQSDGVPVVGWQKATALALDNFVCLGHGK